MTASIFGSPAIDALKRSLDQSSVRQRATAHNIANAETEGYVPERVEFKNELETALGVAPVELARTDARHMVPDVTTSNLSGMVVTPTPGAGIQEFLVDMVKISFLYQAAAKLLAGQYGTLRESIRGRTS